MSKTSLIPVGLTLVGEIEGRGDLVVAGIVEGPVQLEGGLVIEDGGEVRGKVNVTTLLVRGLLTGDATATELIRVEPTAVVVGDASAPAVNIVDGARFRGRVRMTGEPLVPKAARRRRRRPSAANEPPRPTRERDSRPERDAPKRKPIDRERETLTAPPSEVAPEPAPIPAPRDISRLAPSPVERVEAQGADVSNADVSSADVSSEEAPRRRRKRRRKKPPPPPTIPTVGRQKARRKDRGAHDPRATSS